MNDGKKLEKKFKKWMTELNIYFHRFMDAASSGGSNFTSRPSDFWAYIHPNLFLIECKEITRNIKSIPYTNITPSQWKGMKFASINRYIYLVLFDIKGQIYGVNGAYLLEYTKNSNRKSFIIDNIKEYSIKIDNKEDLLNFLKI